MQVFTELHCPVLPNPRLTDQARRQIPDLQEQEC